MTVIDGGNYPEVECNVPECPGTGYEVGYETEDGEQDTGTLLDCGHGDLTFESDED